MQRLTDDRVRGAVIFPSADERTRRRGGRLVPQLEVRDYDMKILSGLLAGVSATSAAAAQPAAAVYKQADASIEQKGR